MSILFSLFFWFLLHFSLVFFCTFFEFCNKQQQQHLHTKGGRLPLHMQIHKQLIKAERQRSGSRNWVWSLGQGSVAAAVWQHICNYNQQANRTAEQHKK